MKLRAAVVGVGYLGKFHAQKYKALETTLDSKLSLVGVCDLNKEQADRVGTELGVKAFYRPEDLLGQVDAVTIATVTSSHFRLAKFFLDNGVHVNVEKPMTATCAEGRELVRLAQEKGLVLSVGQSERFNPAFQKALGLIRRPTYIEMNRMAPYKSRGADVSVIHDLMIHDIDMMLSLDKTHYRVTMARGGRLLSPTLDWATALFEFESGLKVHINSSRIASSMTRSMRVHDAKFQLIADLQTGQVEVASAKSAQEVQHTLIEAGKGDNLLIETEVFVKALIEGKPLVVTGEEGLRALEAVEVVQAMIDSQSGWS